LSRNIDGRSKERQEENQFFHITRDIMSVKDSEENSLSLPEILKVKNQ